MYLFNKKKDSKDFSYSDLTLVVWKMIKGYRVAFVASVIFAILGSLFSIIYINQLGIFTDTFVKYNKAEGIEYFYNTIFYTALFFGLSFTSRIIGRDIFDKIRVSITQKVKIEGIYKLFSFQLNWHQQGSTGARLQKMKAGSEALGMILNMLSAQILPYFFDIVIILISLIGVDFRFLIIFSFYAVSSWTIQYIFGKHFNRIQKARLLLTEENSGQLFDIASNIITSKANSIKDLLINKVNIVELAVVKSFQDERNYQTAKAICMLFVTLTTTVSFLLLLANSFILGFITVGTIVVYIRYFGTVREAIIRLIDVSDIIREQKNKIASMMPIFDEEIISYFGTEDFKKNWSLLRIQDLVYSHPETRDIALNGISLNIPRGNKISFVGRSGSGKSTLAKILMGLYKIDDGKIYFDSKGELQDFYTIKNSSVLNNLHIILQDTEIYNMTFVENLTLLKERNPDLIAKAIKIAKLEEVLAKLPLGLQTKLGEKGYKLSGGEKQRLGIARAICSEADIIIMDEATSALDSKTEQEVQTGLEEELKDKTLILIAHRLSTLNNTNKIYVFENGKIIEEGSFKELLDQDSKFKELWEIQSRGIKL